MDDTTAQAYAPVINDFNRWFNIASSLMSVPERISCMVSIQNIAVPNDAWDRPEKHPLYTRAMSNEGEHLTFDKFYCLRLVYNDHLSSLITRIANFRPVGVDIPKIDLDAVRARFRQSTLAQIARRRFGGEIWADRRSIPPSREWIQKIRSQEIQGRVGRGSQSIGAQLQLQDRDCKELLRGRSHENHIKKEKQLPNYEFTAPKRYTSPTSAMSRKPSSESRPPPRKRRVPYEPGKYSGMDPSTEDDIYKGLGYTSSRVEHDLEWSEPFQNRNFPTNRRNLVDIEWDQRGDEQRVPTQELEAKANPTPEFGMTISDDELINRVSKMLQEQGEWDLFEPSSPPPKAPLGTKRAKYTNDKAGSGERESTKRKRKDAETQQHKKGVRGLLATFRAQEAKKNKKYKKKKSANLQGDKKKKKL